MYETNKIRIVVADTTGDSGCREHVLVDEGSTVDDFMADRKGSSWGENYTVKVAGTKVTGCQVMTEGMVLSISPRKMEGAR